MEETVNAATSLTACSDEDLLARFQNGDRPAFEVFIRRYEKEMFGYLRRYLGDATLADDVFQNTFLQVFVKIDQYSAGRPVRPWLYTIATRQAIDAMRRAGRHQAVSLDQDRDQSSSELPQLLGLLESQEPGPMDSAEGAERQSMVQASVDRLPEFLHQVVLLAYYQGLKYKDVAEILDIPVGTVKSRLHTALIRLNEDWAVAPSPNDA